MGKGFARSLAFIGTAALVEASLKGWLLLAVVLGFIIGVCALYGWDEK